MQSNILLLGMVKTGNDIFKVKTDFTVFDCEITIANQTHVFVTRDTETDVTMFNLYCFNSYRLCLFHISSLYTPQHYCCSLDAFLIMFLKRHLDTEDLQSKEFHLN